MTRSLTDVLASPARTLQQIPGGQQISVFYPSDEMCWAAIGVVMQAENDIEVYDPRDGNMNAFLSSKAPGQRSRPGQPPVKQVTYYKSGTLLFKNVATVDPATISEADIAAGQLLANKYGFINLSDDEVAELAAQAGAELPSEEE